MSIEKQFTRLLEKQREQESLSILQSLSFEQRRALAPHLAKLSREYFKYEFVGNTYKNKATQTQSHILTYAAFACYNRKEFEKENPSWIVAKEHLEKILPWYCPSWFSDYINSFRERDWIPYQLNYDYMIELTKNGFLQPHPHLIARTLVPIIYENKERKNYFKPDNLLKHERTLNEDIWYLFEFETTVHSSNRYIYFEGKEQKEELGWISVFKKYVADGKIDRQRLLKEAILASNRNFNKNLSGWFAELFCQLQPSKEEIISLQSELLVLFSSPHSKPVNTALQSFKQIAEDPSFFTDSFLDNVPLLLASETKTIVTATLQILEKLVKKHGDKCRQVCLLATGAFIHKDESLQTKAAKLIQKYGTPGDEEVTEALALYQGTMFSGINHLLSPLFAFSSFTEVEMPETKPERSTDRSLSPDKVLPSISEFDDLLFLTSQAFDNNQSFHIDLLPAALLKLQKQIKGDQIAKLEPAFQRALKLFFNDWRSGAGYLDQLLACLFLDYGLLLIQKHPESTTSIKNLFGSFMNKQEATKKQWQEHGTNLSFLMGWKPNGDCQLYEPYKKLYATALQLLKAEVELPLLSTPTHTPAWIDPEVLVERLYQYQQQNTAPDPTDLQIALSRCWLYGTEIALSAAHKLEGENKELMIFLLDPQARPKGPFNREWAWMMAALSKAPSKQHPEFEGFRYQQIPASRLTGQYPWKTIVLDYSYDKYNWENGKMTTEKATAKRKVLQVELSAHNEAKKDNGFKKFLSKLNVGTKNAEPAPEPLLVEYMQINDQFLSVEDQDIKRILLLMPNNPEPIVALTVGKCLSHPEFWSETDKRFTIATIQGLHEIWKPLGEMAHLFVATCMISSDKTVASYAAEIWAQAVQEASIDSRLIGSILGSHERIEFAPLKRFTDLVINQLLGISPLHNKALEQLIVALLKELPSEPIKNLKKLLEIFTEVIHQNGSSLKDQEVNNQLQTWKAHAGLSKAIKALEQRVEVTR
jgi:hypothetical protein